MWHKFFDLKVKLEGVLFLPTALVFSVLDSCVEEKVNAVKTKNGHTRALQVAFKRVNEILHSFSPSECVQISSNACRVRVNVVLFTKEKPIEC